MFRGLLRAVDQRQEPLDVREHYDPTFFDGKGLEQERHSEMTYLWNLLVQGEMTRLAMTDLVEETRAMHQTQREILEELRAARAAGGKA